MHFLTALKVAPPSDQRATFDRAVATIGTPAQQELENAEASACPSLDEIYAETRAIAFVANAWSPRHDFDDPRQSAKFLAALHDTITALLLGPRLTPAQQTTAQAAFASLFDTTTPDASPEPAKNPSGQMADTCAQPHVSAKTLHAVAPNAIPPVLGRVVVLISLSKYGDVRSAKSVSSTLGNGPGSAAALQAAILSAAESSYAPELRNCTAVGGKYAFVVEFNRR